MVSNFFLGGCRVKDHRGNILDFVSHVVSVATPHFWLCRYSSHRHSRHRQYVNNKHCNFLIKLYLWILMYEFHKIFMS